MSLSLLNKYVWLVDTIRNAGRISLKEIQDKWINEEISEGVELPRRTFHKWRVAVEELFDLTIVCDNKHGHKYYIENEDELTYNTTSRWLLNALAVNSMVADSKDLKDRIVLEKVSNTQQKYLPPLINAMKNNMRVTMRYQSFVRKEASTITLDPYGMKFFKQRWYLMGYNVELRSVRTYALDRIKDLRINTKHQFKLPKYFSVEKFFYNCYGIVDDPDIKVEKVVLKVTKKQAYYVRSVPFHHSQKEVKRDGTYCWFELKLKPTYDFVQEVTSYLPAIEVLEPLWVRQEIAEKVHEMNEIYSRDDE